ncbi:HlyD family secretion protein, partial [Achromobacter xylosoxidans]|uniref:HlyD family secretion protein n=1 Tax=Alcaligenes xylosoxydans xylosoxydans TaxID=85698 RepID=UPI001F0D352B
LAGDLLIRLDDTVTRANLAVVTKQLRDLSAQQYRLEAERDDRDETAWPENRKTKPGDIERGQQMLLDARRKSIAGRKDQLVEQVRQFNKQIEGLEAQVEAKRSEIELINEELSDLSGLLGKNLVSKSRVTALKREHARLQGEFGGLVAEIARTKEAI